MSASRRNFLKSVGLLPLAVLPGGHAEASNPAPTAARRLVLNRFSIAGFQYYDGPVLVQQLRPREEIFYEIDTGTGNVEAVVYRGVKGIDPHQLHPGSQLELKAEPSNPHDSFAVVIYLDNLKLGYVPRSDNKHLSRLIEQGAKLDCRVIEIDPEAGVWNMVRVEVGMVHEYKS
jgi:hypothetical protein